MNNDYYNNPDSLLSGLENDGDDWIDQEDLLGENINIFNVLPEEEQGDAKLLHQEKQATIMKKARKRT